MKKIFYLFCITLLVTLSACGGDNPFVFNFDFEQPVVVRAYPSNFMTNIDPDTSIIIQFSKKMDMMKTNNCFSLLSSSGAISGIFTWDFSQTILTFKPSVSLSDATMYTISISTGAEDTEGNDLLVQFVSVFYINNDLAPPEVVSTVPVNDAQGIAPDATITINFSEAIDLDTISDGITISPAIQGIFSWNAAQTVITFTPTYDMSYGTTYTVSVSDAIEDANGNALSNPQSFHFTVGDDTTQPGITSVQTASNPAWDVNTAPNVNIEKDEPITINFSEQVTLADLYDAISISPGVDFYIETNLPTDPFTIATIQFNEPMGSEEYYTLTIDSTITDLQNNQLDDEYVYHFYTNGPNSIAPTITSITDADPFPPGGRTWTLGAVEPLSWSTLFNYYDVTIHFSQAMDPTSLQISITKELGTGGTPTMLNPRWNSPAFTEYTFDLSNLAGATTYKITIEGGSSNTRDQNNNYLKEDFIQYFEF